MEEKKNLIEELFDKAVAYTETSIELFKLKAIEKTSELVSNIAARMVLILVLAMFLFILSIGVALWLGDLLGVVYYGFFIVAAFYLVLALIVILLHPSIKKRITNSIISNILK
jgi:hypothetical protein